MALRPERVLNGHETYRVQALSDLLRLTDDYSRRIITGEIFNSEMRRVNNVLGAVWLSALDAVIKDRNWSDDDTHRLAGPNQRPAIVELYDATNDRHRANEARRYLASLRNDPQELADFIKSVTGARVVTVAFDTIKGGRVQRGPAIISRGSEAPSEAAPQPFEDLVAGPAPSPRHTH